MRRGVKQSPVCVADGLRIIAKALHARTQQPHASANPTAHPFVLRAQGLTAPACQRLGRESGQRGPTHTLIACRTQSPHP